ncbi:MAG TPA: response regulator transcription factor [Arachnia sp.]|nr:response regulator transcription factor [Arachnia sp.]
MNIVRRILVVDDDPMVREAYRTFFSRHSDYEVVGEARDGKEAVAAYRRLRPSVVLMDLQMPEKSGVEATRDICREWPKACIVALTTFGTREYIVAALRAGASGYLLKDAGGPALLTGIDQAIDGDMPLSAAVRKELVSNVKDAPEAPSVPADPGLAPREKELLRWLAQGLTNQQIGTKMFVSEGTIKQYLSHIGDKMGLKSRTQILVRAIQLGVVDLAELDPPSIR